MTEKENKSVLQAVHELDKRLSHWKLRLKMLCLVDSKTMNVELEILRQIKGG